MATTTMVPATTERDRHLNMVFTTAIEGGINYWAQIETYRWSAGETEARNFYADIVDAEDDGKAYRIDRQTISRGIRLAWENRQGFDPYHREALSALKFGQWDDVDYDADTADMVVQFGLFGELIYG